MTGDQTGGQRPIFRDHPSDEEGPDPDIVPDGAPRGGITVPDANDTGTMTPPISGWGGVPTDESEPEED